MERLTALLSVHRRAVTRESEAAMFPHFAHNTAYTIAGRPLLRFLALSGPRAPLRRRDGVGSTGEHQRCPSCHPGVLRPGSIAGWWGKRYVTRLTQCARVNER